MCVLADCLFKQASGTSRPFQSPQFVVAILLQVLSAFGWVYVFRHIKLSTVGTLFSVISIVLLALVGVTVFRESLSAGELTGLVLAVIALVLLARFS